MSEQLKYLVEELNKSPFERNYNLITFDALHGDQLLQITSDVMAEIDAKNKIDIREEEAEGTAIRILGMLRILKYKPPDEIANNFRQGLVEGHKQVIYPVLHWLLSRIPELKKRAYLAKYLVKVDLPPEVSADPDVSEIYEQVLKRYIIHIFTTQLRCTLWEFLSSFLWKPRGSTESQMLRKLPNSTVFENHP